MDDAEAVEEHEGGGKAHKALEAGGRVPLGRGFVIALEVEDPMEIGIRHVLEENGRSVGFGRTEEAVEGEDRGMAESGEQLERINGADDRDRICRVPEDVFDNDEFARVLMFRAEDRRLVVGYLLLEEIVGSVDDKVGGVDWARDFNVFGIKRFVLGEGEDDFVFIAHALVLQTEGGIDGFGGALFEHANDCINLAGGEAEILSGGEGKIQAGKTSRILKECGWIGGPGERRRQRNARAWNAVIRSHVDEEPFVRNAQLKEHTICILRRRSVSH
jgi:hypothetical protein